MPVRAAALALCLLAVGALVGCARKAAEPLPGPPSAAQGGFGPQRIPAGARPPGPGPAAPR